MSIYDDLANSGYLNQEDLKKQFQQDTAFKLEQSMDASHKFVDFNQYDIDSSRVNQEDDHFADDQFKYGAANSHLNPNYKKVFNPNELMHHNQREDPFMLPSDVKSPIAMASDQSQIGQRQNLFRQRNFEEDSDAFLKDSATGLPYKQPQRVLQLEDDDIIQIQHNSNQLELKTGRFATGHTLEDQQYYQQQPANQVYNDEISRFKNQNDQIQQLLQQLQTPFNNMLGESQLPQSNSFINNYNQKPDNSYNFQRSQSEHLQYQSNMPLQQIAPSYQGPNFDKLNKENSILEIAKMQNSGNGSSDNQTNQSMMDNPDQIFNRNYNNISKDFSYMNQQQLGYTPVRKENFVYQGQDNQDYFKMPTGLNTNLNTVGNSIISYQKFIPPYPAAPGGQIGRNVSAYDQENIDQNIFQMKGGMPNQLAEQSLVNDSNLVKLHQQIPQQPIPNQIHYNRQMSDMDIKKKQLMSNFDEIPIKDLNKNEVYQQQRLTEGDEDYQEQDESQLSLLEKIEHPKWKVRMNAYKEISSLFYNEYSKECMKNKGQKMEDDLDNEESQNIRPFDQYGPVLHKIISDTNLVAQYEGLNCLFAFIKFSPDIKSVIFQVNAILLEKIQHNKPNFKEITMKILINILKKDKSQSILPELLKRFKNKNPKIATFSSEVVVEGLRNQLLNDEQTLKTLFKAAQDNLSHSNKELREITIEIIKNIFKNCDDDLNVFMKNLKNLRPVQLKDIKDNLVDVEKSKNLVQLFKNQQAPPQTYTEGFSPKKTLAKEQIYDQEDNEPVKENLASDLNLLVPDNFNEIPYINQINVKKKSMETFNAELEKIINRNQYAQVQIKDYTQIFNIVTHMLEDSNALVFMEAIKTVEYLSIILGKNIKPQKLRQFISLLADKYKETKTAPVAAVNKTLSTIIKKQSLPFSQLIDYMINQLAFNSKNARVKQLTMEKVDQTIQEESTLNKDEQLLSSIFKAIKDKTIGFIQKDTNASVRDAAVSLIGTFKAYLSSNQMVNDTINTLPKYRIAEITKLASEKLSGFNSARPQSTTTESAQNQNNKKGLDKQSSNGQISESTQDDFFYQGKNISGQYQIHLAEIILSLKKMGSSNNFGISTLQQKWDDSIENLGELGIKESKSVIVSCIHWLFSKHNTYIRDSQQVVESVLNLMKKVFCIERSVDLTNNGSRSKELEEALQSILMGAKWLNNTKQLENVFNVLLSASPSVTLFMDSLLKGFTFMKQNESEESFIGSLDFAFKWIALKIDQLMTKGMIQSDFEDLRSQALTYLEDLNNDNQRNRLIQIMVNFKNAVNEAKKKMEYMGDQSSIDHNDEDDEQQDEEEKEVHKIIEDIPQRNEVQEVKPKSIGQQFIEVIDQNFENGLQMLKSFQMNPQILDTVTKEQIFSKMLSIVANHCKNPIQQQQQAFALKALLWMKEELLSLEDCFQFAPSVMIAYATAEYQGRDSSVELYLLNNWVKQLRLRDLIDRVSNACSMKEEVFSFIFGWLMMHSLNGNQDDKWQIEDFRKLSLQLAKNLRDDQVQEFFRIAVEKFGLQKVQQFMEIQLMHNLQEYNQFMNWISNNFKSGLEEEKKQNVKLPEIVIDRSDSIKQPQMKKYDDLQLKEALQDSDNVNESVVSSARGRQGMNIHSKLYQELREKRKTSNQRKIQESDDGFNKYDHIINRLEAQLQQQAYSTAPVEEKKSVEKERNFQFHKSNASNFYQSEKSNRYQILKTEDDDEELDQSTMSKQNEPQKALGNQSKMTSEEMQMLKTDHQIENKEEALKESTMKEGLWKMELEKLEMEKKRIERERYELLHAKNKETAEWKEKYDEMRQEHEDVINNLREANKCYLTQVSENEDLKKQLQQMQDQNKLMMKKFEEFEKKLNHQEEQAILQKLNQQKNESITVVKQEQLALVEKVFKEAQVQSMRGEEEIGTKRIQELLLNFDNNEETQKIGVSLFIHYQSLKHFDQRIKLANSLALALESEDVLFALPLETYKTLLDFNLKVFANEKAQLDRTNIRASTQSMARGNPSEQNEITVQVQKLVSKLLNSKEFTTSLVTLFQILRNAMPEDLATDLSEEQRHYLKVVMRCISRITKALHSENPDLVRAFDVLIEMQKIFLKNPPENLREDLPCLQDFDAIYRGLKDVTDKLMELQPEKVITFLEFVKNQPQNAFIKYMNQIMAPKQKEQHHYDDYEQDELYDEGY